MNLLLTTDRSVALNQICSYVCQAIIAIQEQEPELLLERYRNVAWRGSRNQSILTEKLTEVLRHTLDLDALLQQLQRFLKALLIPEAFNSPTFIELLKKIRQLNSPNLTPNALAIPKDIDSAENKSIALSPSSNGSASPEVELSDRVTPNGKVVSLQQQGIAVLLLDAENIQLNTETEQRLTTVCTCPLQVKIAFANWRCMGKQDVEFHQRGYDLIHVPAGRDNADGKMIAVGLSIHERYPKAKEVLVCSSDTVMTNLCNHLQQNGLVVHRVSKQGNNITILNSQNGEKQTPTMLPSIEQFINQIKEIIGDEEARTSNQWIKLSKISSIFHTKYNLRIKQVVSHHLPGKTVKDIFINQSELAVYQSPEDTEIYLGLFKMPQPNNKVETKSDLEQALVKIITVLAGRTPSSYISVQTLSGQFHQQYGQGIKKILKNLDLNANFPSFLNSCSSFQLRKTGNSWQVALR